MKKIGLVGGLAWVSTVEYYSEIHRAVESRFKSGQESSLEMCIESLDLKTALSYIGEEGDESSWSKFDAYHRNALLRLQQNGIECAAIASNTPHSRFDSIVRGVDMPVLDMFTVVAKVAAGHGLGQVLILGTPLTMKSGRFKNVLSAHRVHAIEVTDDAAVSETFELIGRLQTGSVQEAAETIGGIVRRLWNGPLKVQPCVILACTELPLAFPESLQEPLFISRGITYINPIAIHIQAILECAYEKTKNQAVRYFVPAAQHASSLRAMARKCFADTFSHLYDSRPFEDFLDQAYGEGGSLSIDLLDPTIDWLAAEANAQIVGYAKLRQLAAPAPDPQKGALELQQIYVLREWQGLGVAERLMQWALDRGRALGAPEIYLTVFDHNERAKRFYTRHGFAEVGSCTFELGSRIDDDRVWRKAL